MFRNVLVDAGASEGFPVALIGGSHPETYFARAASYMEGARVTALHPENGIDDHIYALDYLATEFVFYESSRFDARITEISALRPDVNFVPMPHVDPAALQNDTTLDLSQSVQVAPDDTVGVSLSGGTTGTPKGIIHLDRTLTANAIFSALEWDWPAKIRFLVSTPLSHASGAMALPILLQGGGADHARQVPH